MIAGCVTALLVCGCAADPGVKKSQDGTVKELDSGNFLFSFKRDRLDLRQKDRATEVAAYMNAHGLIPKRCGNGISVILDGNAENGYGWALLRCAGQADR